MNKIEALKAEKDGLEIQDDLVRFAREGWKTIGDDDKERLKWVGVFMRRPTPGHAMMRIRMPNGLVTSAQVRLLARLTRESGRTIADITTRQQLQLRWVTIERVPDIITRLEAAGLSSFQTGMDNIRGIIGCPATGLTPGELIDTAPIAREFQRIFLGNKDFTNLPRKFNVTITGCREHCTGGETQDISMTPALFGDGETPGFNVAVGGKQGSGGPTVAFPLDAFVRPGEAAEACAAIALIFRDHGPRESRSKARLAFLLGEWGVERFRAELEARLVRPLPRAGRDARGATHGDHIGVYRQRQPGLNYVGLKTPVGRVTADQLDGLARLSEAYGQGELRFTPSQDVLLPHVPDARLGDLTQEPLPHRYQDTRHGARQGFREGGRQDAPPHGALVRLPSVMRQPSHRRHRASGVQGQGGRQGRGRRPRIRRRPRRERPPRRHAHHGGRALRRAAAGAGAAGPLLPAPRAAGAAARAPTGRRGVSRST